MSRHFSKVDNGSLEKEVLNFLLVSKRSVTHLRDVKSVIFQLLLTRLLSLEHLPSHERFRIRRQRSFARPQNQLHDVRRDAAAACIPLLRMLARVPEPCWKILDVCRRCF